MKQNEIMGSWNKCSKSQGGLWNTWF